MKRSENWSRPIPSIGLGRRITTTTWKTIHALNSDHLPILLTIQTDNKHTIQQNRRSYTNYRKADWDNFTQDTEYAFTAIQPPTDIHYANKTFTNILYQACKKHIPVGRIRNTEKLLPQPIRNKIAHSHVTLVSKISAYSWWNCQATHNRLQIEINYYPDSLLFIAAGFLPRVSSQRLN